LDEIAFMCARADICFGVFCDVVTSVAECGIRARDVFRKATSLRRVRGMGVRASLICSNIELGGDREFVPRFFGVLMSFDPSDGDWNGHGF
jgi:hypothetical protein